MKSEKAEGGSGESSEDIYGSFDERLLVAPEE